MPLPVRFAEGVVRACSALGALIIFIMMVHICADVAVRYFSSTPLIGTLEIVSSYYMIAITFLPLGLVELKGEQVFVEVFTQRLPQKYRDRMDFVARVATALIFGAIAISCGLYAYDKMIRNEFQDLVYYDLPIWPSRWIICAGFALTSVAAACAVVRVLAGRESYAAAHPGQATEH